MSRIGRRQPAGTLVITTKSLAHEDKTLAADIVSVTGTAYDASVKVKPNAGTVIGTVLANSPLAANKPKPGAIIADVDANDPVTGSFRDVPADRAFVSTVAFDAIARVGPVAPTATVTGTSNAYIRSIPPGTVNVTSTVNAPSAIALKVNGELVTVPVTTYDPIISYVRMFLPGEVSATATAYAQNKIILIPNPVGIATVSVLVLDVPNQGLGVFPAAIAPPAVAYQPVAKLRLLPDAAVADVDALIGIFSPRPADVTATAYNVQFYLDTVDWRTRDVEQEVRSKVIPSESRTLTVSRRQNETRVR